ncbi:MAG: hypothetical protein CO113_10290 [Elusimicrobia bacterium CG_4_9_14_3_um_filter_62_55]|nr:MAG: hypothetical protein COR54_12750 [Elusimicrobia bacterium CG22_combo_CG10-13_8_21_14_all_63_91]PJA18444.1 MAG: hypothetical protein COX66_01190 [Elusimicrobia bacterium CG_4_10_14_0_2_um_filter_63_34]PJB25122.1 MAG: hypothetical protein CO113_10290 [Elusimicrobia bacterium CG_4_9_14_3_um_filter_62_55]
MVELWTAPPKDAVVIRPLHSLERFDAALEAALEALTREPETAFYLGLRPWELDESVDRILASRMSAAPTESIRASYRTLLGKVGHSLARVAFRRLQTALNGERFARLGAAAPRLLIDCLGADPAAAIAALHHDDAVFLVGARRRAEAEAARPCGPGLERGFAEAKQTLDKLANYQIDLGAIGAELERIARA